MKENMLWSCHRIMKTELKSLTFTTMEALVAYVNEHSISQSDIQAIYPIGDTYELLYWVTLY